MALKVSSGMVVGICVCAWCDARVCVCVCVLLNSIIPCEKAKCCLPRGKVGLIVCICLFYNSSCHVVGKKSHAGAFVEPDLLIP